MVTGESGRYGAVIGAFGYLFNDFSHRASSFIPPSLPQWVVDFSAGLGDGILATMSLGFVDGQYIRDSLGIDGGVNLQANEYIGGRVTGTAITIAAFMMGARPSTLTHYTTETGALGITESGLRASSGGVFGGGRYASSMDPYPRNLFVPSGSKVPIEITNTARYLRVFPGTFLQPTSSGYIKTGAWVTLYGSLANRKAFK
ncbi:MAG: hypothetical protein LBS40_06740 [Burkholderiales bacterium]|jgi:hypothetical protein|nr:hypothetical protein [Burkholderiales bacterium]